MHGGGTRFLALLKKRTNNTPHTRKIIRDCRTNRPTNRPANRPFPLYRSERHAISLIGFLVHAGVRKITSYVMFIQEFICRI